MFSALGGVQRDSLQGDVKGANYVLCSDEARQEGVLAVGPDLGSIDDTSDGALRGACRGCGSPTPR